MPHVTSTDDCVRSLTAAEVDGLLAAAQAAPSLHNSQPWSVTVHGERLEVHVDTTHATSVADPSGRQRVVSAGAALFNLRLAVRSLGRQAAVRLFPEPEQPGLVAVLTVGAGTPPSPEERRLFEVVGERRTWRGPFSPTPLAEVLPPQLSYHAVREGALLVELSARANQDRLADLLVAAVAEQIADPARAAEQHAWLRVGPASDGIPLDNILNAVYPVPGLYLPGSSRETPWQPAVRGLAYRDTLMALVTTTDEPEDWAGAGCALQRVLLTATRFGLAAGFLNQPLESPRLRQELSTAMDLPGHPQMLLRLGYPDGAPPRPTPRRIVHAVLPTAGQEGQRT
ncbi:MAG: nitroreductase family protein [Actinobacteria bacterium]|nr:nitroreductase family protein [Actinomycetota bacterium]